MEADVFQACKMLGGLQLDGQTSGAVVRGDLRKATGSKYILKSSVFSVAQDPMGLCKHRELYASSSACRLVR